MCIIAGCLVLLDTNQEIQLYSKVFILYSFKGPSKGLKKITLVFILNNRVVGLPRDEYSRSRLGARRNYVLE